jgi:uncharacterized LabA/DUF88 family protein
MELHAETFVPKQTDSSSLGSIFVDYENLVLTLTNQFQLERSEAENRFLDALGNVEHALNERGVRVVKREAFADWSAYPTTSNELYRMGYRTRNVGATAHKNSADIELSLSVQEEMLRKQEVSMLVIAAGDRDYMPIALRAIESAKDLLVVGFSDSLSGDLKELVGPNGYLYIDPRTSDLIPASAESDLVRPAPLLIKGSSPRALTPEEDLALKAAIESYDEYKPQYGDVKISGFLVVALEKALPGLSHLQRKDVFGSLVKKGMIKTSAKQDSYGATFAVFSVNEDHPIVKDERERVRKATQQGRALLIRAAKTACDDNGSVKGADLAIALRELDPSFDPRSYGVFKIADFVELYPDILRLEGQRTATDPTYKSQIQ